MGNEQGDFKLNFLGQMVEVGAGIYLISQNVMPEFSLLGILGAAMLIDGIMMDGRIAASVFGIFIETG